LESQKNQHKRKIIAFVGGLDICDGRFDTPRKTLFRSLTSDHATDFHQVWTGISQKYGPRQPWQDIHSKVTGAVARDVLSNFERRWKTQHPNNSANNLINIKDSEYLSLEEEAFIDDAHSSTIQFLRSIDKTSDKDCKGIERSIQDTYLNAIRLAKHFIYIENQYFMGSSDFWINNTHSGLANHIPLELVKKIEEKNCCQRTFLCLHCYPFVP